MNTSSTLPTDDSLRVLVQQLERAYAAGQHDEAQSLLARAKSVAPDHPLVLNVEAMLALRRGDAEAARILARRALAQDDKNPAFWINLASACRRLGLREDEMTALDRALAIDPRHLLALLQKASLLDLTSGSREAARTYRHALQTIPAEMQLPTFLRPAMERAMQAVKDDNDALEAFLRQRLRAVEQQHAQADRERFEHCVEVLLGKRKIYTPQPTFLQFPKLPAWEFYPRRQFPWLDEIEAAADEIRSEFERIFHEDADALEPYVAYAPGVPLDQWKELNHSRRWSVLYLWRDGNPVEQHLKRCPRTAALIANAPRVDIENVGPTAFFSILDAGSHIPAHTGVTNTRLIVHLPLIVPPGCRFRVGSQTREWLPGRAWVFDDTIEHEAWNDSDVPRAVLIFDIWNPYLEAAERDLIRATVSGVTEYYGRAHLADAH